MIKAYLDESGVHDSATVCIIAGYYGGIGQWKKFENLWRKIFKAASISTEEFHAKDWVKARDKDNILGDLARAIGEYKIYPISIGVVIADFNSFPEDIRRFLTGARINLKGEFTSTGSPNRPYYMPFQHCIKRIAGYAPRGGKAHFSFGLSSSFAGYALNLINQIKADPIALYADRLGTIQFPEAKGLPALQAADLLVHLTYLDMQKRIATNGWLEQPTGLLRTCLKNMKDQFDHVYFNKQCIELMLSDPKLDVHSYM